MKSQSSEGRFMDGNYRMIRRLGSGGDGTVYLVEHIPTERLRAAKRIEESRAGERMHELNMMKHLHHPSLPQIIDILECAGQTWLVMEYIMGRALSETDSREVTAEQFFQIAVQLAQAVRYLHTRSAPILHLDIKPTNVLLQPDGRLVLIDFGAAVFLKKGTKTHCCVGTPGFAAPEQYEKECVDTYTDIYAYGATLYFYLYRSMYEKHPLDKVQSEKRRQMRFFRRKPWWKRQADHLLTRCLYPKGELRIRSGSELEPAVRRVQKKYLRRKKMQNAWCAAVFLAVVLAFFAGTVKPDMEQQMQRIEQTYVELLEKAAGMGLVQAGEWYYRAVSLIPMDRRWYAQLLSKIENDYLFAEEEEQLLQELLYAPLEDGSTVLELIKRDAREYGALAYRIGIDYWYYYDGAGAKNAAAQWFEDSVSHLRLCQKESGDTEDLLKAAQIYSELASYYEKLGRQDEEGRRHEDFYRYWKDLKRLWGMQESVGETFAIQRQIAREILSVVTMKAAQLREAGEERSVIEAILKEVDTFFSEEVMHTGQGRAEDESREDAVQHEAARAAVERVFSDERGNTIEENQKETRENWKRDAEQ